MQLIPTRKSKKQRALKAARKTAKQAAKAKAVQKAPKTAGAIWAGKRSGKLLRAGLLVGGGAFVFKKLRGKGGESAEQPGGFAPPAAPETPAGGQNGTSESYRTTPTPASSQQTEGGVASGPDPSGPTATAQAKDDVKQTAPGTDATSGEGAAGDLAESAPSAAPAESESATPPHGDPLADDATKES